MSSFGSRDEEPVRYLTLTAKSQYTHKGKQTSVEDSAFIEAVITSTEVIFNDENEWKVSFSYEMLLNFNYHSLQHSERII